jgi:hypothetical protein
MEEWIDLSDNEAWQKSPSKVEILCEDGSIGKLAIFTKTLKDGSQEAQMVCDEGLNGASKWTHWRPLKK